MAHAELVRGRDKFIIFIMVDDIQVDELTEVMSAFVKTRTYIDAINIKDPKDLDLFRKKLQYAMPQIPLRDVPKDAENPEERNPNFPPQFNRLNQYGNYNRRRRGRNQERMEEEGRVQEVEQETEL